MAKNKKTRDPLPDEFPSWREAAEFWDTHDTEDYAEYWHPVNETIEFIEEPRLQVKLSSSLTRKLQRRAKKMRVSVETLVNRLLTESIRSKPKVPRRIADRQSKYRTKKN